MARIAIGGLLLGLIAAVWRFRRGRRGGPIGPDASQRESHTFSGLPLPSARVHGGRVLCVVIGALGVVFYQPAFFAGTATNGVALSTIVTLGSAPLLTGLLSWMLTRRTPEWPWWVATAAAVIGVALLAGIGAGPTGGVGVLGIVASLCAGLCYAVYTVAAKELIQSGWTSTGSMGALFGVAAAVALPVLVFTDPDWLGRPAGIAVALWLGAVTTAAAYVLFGWGLASLTAPTVATLTLVEPLTAALLGVLALHESLGTGQILGMAFLVLGILVLAIASGRHGSRGR